MAGGYFFEAGLRPGDVIRMAPAAAGTQAWAAVEVLEGGRADSILQINRRWPVTIDFILFLVGLEFLAAGLLVLLRASDRKAANRFVLLSTAVAITLIAFPAIGNGHPWALFLEWVGSKVGMAAFVLFFLTVPVDRWRKLRLLLAWAPLPILTFYSFCVVAQPEIYPTVKLTGYSYMAISLVISIAAMLWPFATRSPKLHRRLWPVLVAAILSAGLYLLGGILPYLLFRRYLLPAETAILGLGLLPLGFSWAMLNYPILGMSIGPWAVMKTVFDTISESIFVVRSDGRLIDASRAGLELLGIRKPKDLSDTFEQAISRCELVGPAARKPNAALLERLMGGNLVIDEEMQLRHAGGQQLWVNVTGTPLLDEQGRVEMVVLVYRDISEQKRRELERQELERQREEFFANVSHDLKTPISAIQASLGVVLANEPGNMPEPLHRMLVNIGLSATKMSGLVEDLLELERFQAGRAQLKLLPCSLRDVALRAAASIESLAAARKQKLELELPSDEPIVLADSKRLERALANLLSNANQYGRSGGAIRLGLQQRNGEALFVVADDGPGIPEAEQEKIFDRFYRGGKDYSGNKTGSGLGLPITRAIVEMHGGRVWVESQPGAGAAFWVALPNRQKDGEIAKGSPA
jgi:PAS domain S-box-containing protein